MLDYVYSPFTKITYRVTSALPPWSSFSELSEVLSPGLQSSFAPNKTSLTTLMLCTFFTRQDIDKTCYFNLLSHAQTLFRCFTNCVPKTFFILLISHKCIVGVKSIKAACFGHFLSLVSIRSPCVRNKMHSFSSC